MDATRREFLRYATGAGVGTALGGLAGLGLTLAPARAKAQALRIKDSKTVPSICPFCSVGCATLIHVKDGEIINIEGDPRSPHNEGTLCPKGAAIYQLHKNPNRPTKVLHRKPGAKDWEEVELDLGDGPRRGADQEDARRDVHRADAGRQARQHDVVHLRAGRRDARQRVQSRGAEVLPRPRHRRD